MGYRVLMDPQSSQRRIQEPQGLRIGCSAVERKGRAYNCRRTQVDLIISEWMGFYLVHESMLDSVLTVRPKLPSRRVRHRRVIRWPCRHGTAS